MPRLLFVTRGTEMVHLGSALEAVRAELGLEVRSRPTLPSFGEEDALERLDRDLDWAEVVLFEGCCPPAVLSRLAAADEADRRTPFVRLDGGAADAARPVGSRGRVVRLADKVRTLLPVTGRWPARSRALAVRYWTAGGRTNLEGLLRLAVVEQAGGSLPPPPVERPAPRLEDLETGRAYASPAAYHAARPPAPSLPTVALLFHSGLHHDASLVGARALACALDRRANLLPIATDGLRRLDALERVLRGADGTGIDALVSLLSPGSEGGALGGTPDEAEALLVRLDVPLFVPATLHDSPLDAWRRGQGCRALVEASEGAALPERLGAFPGPPILGFERSRVGGLEASRAVALEEGVAHLAERVLTWVRLRGTARADRRLALIVHGVPTGRGPAGSASQLDVSTSLAVILARLGRVGYDVGAGSRDPLGDIVDARAPTGDATGRWYGKVFVGLHSVRPSGPPGEASPAVRPPCREQPASRDHVRSAAVDVVVHVGLDGPPGDCFPDLVRSETPRVCLCAVGDPAASAMARRRLQAMLVTHHLPDLVPAGLQGEHRELRQAAIPEGLHVFGRPKGIDSLLLYLARLARRLLGGERLDVLAEGAARERGLPVDEVVAGWMLHFVEVGVLPRELVARLGRVRAGALDRELRSLADRFLADAELPGLEAALDGRFVAPGLVGDPLRSPEVYPTGRNGFGLEPSRIPTPAAVERGAVLGEALLARCHVEAGRSPRTVGLVLRGAETARTGGETVGQLLYLVGARVAEAPGRAPSFEPVPAAELGRPRVDVHLTICGSFRDMFPALVCDLDLLLRAVVALGPGRAGARIFGPRPGEQGTALPATVDGSAWAEPSELGELHLGAMGHAYGAAAHGAPARAELRELLGRTEAVCQIVDGDDSRLGDLDGSALLGGACRAVENVRADRPLCLFGDSTGAAPRLVDASEEIEHCCATRLLNPRWIDAMLEHRRHGAQQIAGRVACLLGLAATVGVPSGAFDRVFETFVEDADVFERLAENDRVAAQGLVRRLGEAARRGLWRASPEQLSRLEAGGPEPGR